MKAKKIKIAVACSGLGHIRRGVETWAEDLARALWRQQSDVTLFQGGGQISTNPFVTKILSTPPRFEPALQRKVRRLQKLGGWRYGFGSGYQAEQTFFTLRLWERVRSDYDIVHVQDPWVALLMERLHRTHLSRPRVILAHGTEESVATLQNFAVLQHLAPCYMEEWNQHRPTDQAVFAVPNFVDTQNFKPGDKQAARTKWDLPQDHLIVLSVAAIKAHHKRVDYLIREFAQWMAHRKTPALLVIAGAHEAETAAIMALGHELLGNRVRFLEGLTRDKMPSLYQAADLFTLASLHEMMPIAVLEALASGLPIACNQTPTLCWMAGPAGKLNDISCDGALVKQLDYLSDKSVRASLGANARAHAEAVFSEAVVTEQYLAMYKMLVQQPAHHFASGKSQTEC